MSRKLRCIICIAAIISVISASFSVFAAGEPAYILKSETDGAVMTVTVGINGSAKAAGGNYTIWYNAEKLELVSGVSEYGYVTLNNNYSENSVRASIANTTAVTEDTVWATYTFNVKNGTADSADVLLREYKIYNEKSELIACQVVGGDVSGDGERTIVDAKTVLENVAQLNEFNEAQIFECDMNLDGNISVADAKLILVAIASEAYYTPRV